MLLEFATALIALTAALGAVPSFAADWRPDKRIEFVVPNAAGGGNDRIGRLVQHIAQEKRFVEPVMTITNKPEIGRAHV